MPQLPSHIARAGREFSTIRRQQFMYWEAYEAILESLDELEEDSRAWMSKVSKKDKLDLGWVAALHAVFGDKVDRISLEYTGGAPMEELKGLYPAAVDAFEDWCFSYRDWSYHEFNDVKQEYQSKQMIPCPVELEDFGAYLELLRLLSMGVLFGEGEQLRRIAQLIKPVRDIDTIVEDLLIPFVVDPKELNEFVHIDLYDDLMGAAWKEGVEESSRCMTKFLNSWYKFFEGCHWHGTHLSAVGEYPQWSRYYGYFAWEAAAIAYLYELDDSAYCEHMLYPKDLVEWARKQGPVPKQYEPPVQEQGLTLSAQPGQACPREGVWFAPHLEMKEVQMKQGQPMPGELYGPTGSVTWYFKG